jgi:cytochrome c-type biogenesis protein
MNGLNDLPIVWAFGAGLLASVNPCGFVLLPSYIALYLGTNEQGFQEQATIQRLVRAVFLGLMVTLGFVVIFSVVGVVFTLGGRALIQVTPWASGGIGLVLIAFGIAMLFGRALHLPFALPTLQPRGQGLSAAFMFGIAYAVASLSCTLPIFLVIVGGTLALQGGGVGLMLFVSYALGMGTVLVALTLGAALFKNVVARYLRAALPYVERASAVLLVGAGAYLVAYQLYYYGGFGR